MRSSVVVAQKAAHRLNARKPLREATMRSGRLSIAIAGGNDEVGRTVESNKQVHMTWVEDATKEEGLGKNMLDVCCDPRGVTST